MEYMQTLENIRANIRRVIIGKDAVIDHLLISLLCSGHVLIEDMPASAKPPWRAPSRPLSAAPSGASSSPLTSCPPTSPVSPCST